MEAITGGFRDAPREQAKMSRVQRAHRRHEPDDVAFRARLPRRLLHPGNGADGFHEAVGGL